MRYYTFGDMLGTYYEWLTADPEINVKRQQGPTEAGNHWNSLASNALSKERTNGGG